MDDNLYAEKYSYMQHKFSTTHTILYKYERLYRISVTSGRDDSEW